MPFLIVKKGTPVMLGSCIDEERTNVPGLPSRRFLSNWAVLTNFSKLPVRSLPRPQSVWLLNEYLIEEHSHNGGYAVPVAIPCLGEEEC